MNGFAPVPPSDADHLMQAGSLEEALTLAQRAVAGATVCLPAHGFLASVLLKLGRAEDAEQVIAEAVSQWWTVSLESASSCCPLVQESPSVAEVLQLLPRRREAQMQINDRSGTLVGLWLITTLPLPAVV
jgi:hypothetical protein